jgi:GT2 family glycosyltransferase
MEHNYLVGEMQKDYIVGIPTYTRYDLLDTVIKDFLQGDPLHIYIINNGNKQYNYENDKVTVIKTHYNLGVARSWEVIANLAFPHTFILANDDISFTPDVVKSLFESDSEITLSSEGFSLVKITQAAYQKVGPFDTRFYPAYYEDNDYYERAVRAGVSIARSDVKMTHHASSTIKSYDKAEREAFNHFFRVNENYYISKWGELPK